MKYFEGDSEVEDIFNVSDSDCDDCIAIATLKKLTVKRGPTMVDYVPFLFS